MRSATEMIWESAMMRASACELASRATDLVFFFFFFLQISC
jgi:hypothetical protein